METKTPFPFLEHSPRTLLLEDLFGTKERRAAFGFREQKSSRTRARPLQNVFSSFTPFTEPAYLPIKQ